MNFGWFASILVHHPIIVLSAVAVFSGTCIIIPLTLKSVTLPSFKDPQLGFSTRGTKISNRLTTWKNLLKSTRPSGEYTTNPKEYLYIQNKNKTQQPPKTKNSSKLKPKKHRKPKKLKEPVFGSETLYEDSNSSNAIAELNRWKAVQNLTPKPHKNFESNDENFFCGNPDEQYAHFVVSTHNKRDLFNINDLLTMCKLEHELIDLNYYEDLCIQNNNQKCCKHWSLPNYVAFLNKRASCLAITAEDVEMTKRLLMQCSPYFHSFELNSQCLIDAPYCEAPIECLRHDAVFNVLNFITSTSFLAPNSSMDVKVKETMVFLPLACSTAIMPYYHELEKLTLKFDGLRIVAMEFGIKSALFDEFLLRDTYLMGSGALFVFICIWIYTQSLFLTIMTIIVIIFSLAISYFMYNLVFEIKFFPFMNLLATIVAIGIGSDDAFIFCKIWQIQKQDSSCSLLKVMADTFHHAFMSMFVTALTTSVAFLGSYVSSVTAVSCFSIFAGMAVIANYCLMMTWFPACLVIWERSCLSNEALFKSCFVMFYQRWCCIKLQLNLSAGWCQYLSISRFFKTRENWILDYIIKFKYFWFLSLVTLALISGFIVFVYPKIQLPDTNEFQLFVDSHPFEQYDFKYKNHFWFTRPEKNDQVTYKLPLRFVWGVLPIDNGDYLDPSNLGTLTPDPSFDMSDPESQEWLLNFCQSVREQPFYQSMIGPLLPNCFVETFMKSMDRKCYDPFLDQDRSPCCETAKFPFNRTVFNKCIINEIADIYNTPSNLLNPGMAGPKFSKDQNPTIKIVIIEYDSSYSYSMSYEQMDSFFKNVEEWMTKQLESAPIPMKNGWFISELAFYDLQRELNASTQISIMISMGLALIVLFLSTLNILTSLYAIMTITSSISVTMAVLVLLGWKLNILESTAVSTAIGLTVDFSLHYSVNYRMCPESVAVNREAATKHALNYMAGPAFMAAITTGAAGAFMLPSLILPYIQIGIFLVLVMCVSWIYATFMLGSMLAISGPIKDWGQFHYPNMMCLFGRPKRVQGRSLPQPSTLPDCHELESLTFPKRNRPSPKQLRRSMSASGGARFIPSKYVFTDQSPSATSAITIIMTDDN
ncbi:protein dispatched [Diorhabda sublineata]|uniref:protein dispatched n=1 Tax=Diorhabda sublineata TaxID=1163346 RepID=UPI0024E16EF8|nr:protein dispatched [Diorhabda sublineata]